MAPAIPPGSLILVTGCNGFIGVAGVAHVASILSFDPNPYKVIPDVIAGAVNAATSASKESSVKRFVYTSSSTAITAPKPNVEFTISTHDWNTEDVNAAWKPPPYEPERAWAVYGASKTQAEQEMWKFVKEKKPNFVLNTVLPNTNMGEILHENQPASTGAWVKGIYEGSIDHIKDIPPQWMVNVKDTARLHVAALIDPGIENERILAFCSPFNWNDVLACLGRLYPQKTFPDDIEDEPRDLSKLNNSRGADLLKSFGRPGWTSLEESVRDNTAGLQLKK
ncbi:hypothetical protein P7C71_g3180, partial [Lecanoromycetidae sp. Uapishka_2]